MLHSAGRSLETGRAFRRAFKAEAPNESPSDTWVDPISTCPVSRLPGHKRFKKGVKWKAGVLCKMSVTRPFRRYFTPSFLILGLLQLSALGSSRSDDAKQIEVRLTPKKKTIRVGETLEVRVEIWNVSPQPLFIHKDIFELCGDSPLSLRLELGPPIRSQPGHGCAADCVYRADDSFPRRLVFSWTILPPRDFYGTVVSMNPRYLPTTQNARSLAAPGHIQVDG